MNKSTQKVIENLKKQIAERKSMMEQYAYYKAIKTVADDILPYDSSKSIKPALLPESYDIQGSMN